MDDIDLLRSYVEKGSESAFTELVHRHIRLVYFAALRQVGGDAALAEDVAQLVFTDLARKSRSLLARPVLTGWLYTSTRFAAANARRSEQRRKAREQEAYTMQAIASDTPASSHWEKLGPVIDDALHTLDESDREAVLLRFFEGRAFAEIGSVLRLSEEAARKRVDRALDRLAGALAKRGVTSTAASLSVVLANQIAVTAPTGIAASVAGAALAESQAGVFGGLTAATFGMTLAAIVVGGSAIGVGVNHSRTAQAARVELGASFGSQQQMQATLRRLEQKFAATEQRARAADADAAQLLKAIQEASPKVGFPPGDAVCVAFVVDTSGSMRNPQNGGLWPATFKAMRDTLAAHPEAKFIMGFDADGRILFSGQSGWLPVTSETFSAVEQVLKTYAQDSISNPVPGIYRAMRELPPPGKSGARLHVCVIGDEFIDQEEPALRRLNELNPADASGQRRASISAVQLPTTMRSTGEMANTGRKFQTLMNEVAKHHAGTFKLLPAGTLE